MERKYYKTGDLSKIYKLGRDSIKYYEKLGLLNPVRDSNSYRMYTIKDICNLNLIRELRSLDFSMQRIKEYIEKKVDELNCRRNSLKNRLSSIEKCIEHT
ncbi:MAG: MerR family transcriptional regulator, partial [Clostridium sp.]